MKQFLDIIAERMHGEALLAGSDNGYNLLPSSKSKSVKTFDSYSEHPGATVVNSKETSTMAGRYNITYQEFVDAKRDMKLNDFGPEAQDQIATRKLTEFMVGRDIQPGDYEVVMEICSLVFGAKVKPA